MRRFGLRLVLVLLLVVGVSYFIWLPAFGTFLIRSDDPQPADAVIVLAGDFTGKRIETGGDLVRRKLAGYALISGPSAVYGQNEADLAIQYAVRKGFEPNIFRPIYHQSDSTREEALFFRGILLKNGIRKVLIVTSEFHTRRAGSIFRRTIPGIDVRMIAAATPGLDPPTWWKHRWARKVIYQEWTKTLADWLGI